MTGAPIDKHDAAQLVAAMQSLGTELAATRQYFLAETATTGQRIEAKLEQIAGAVDHIRTVVDGLDGMVKQVVAKVQTIKLPKWLGALQQGE